MMDRLSKMTQNMDIWDIALTKLAVFFFTIVIVKLFVQLLDISYLMLVLLTAAAAARPLWRFFAKK
ncbi:MAG: hypothetical protein WC490_00810 [Candidatus Margulisiibacteriota bacterium]